MASFPRPGHPNEIHDMATPQNAITSRPPRYKSLEDLFPPGLLKKVVAEMIATFLLVFVTCGSAALYGSNHDRISQLGQSVAGGLVVTVMIYAVGHISGAHMNPAVTLAFAVLRHFPWIQELERISCAIWSLTCLLSFISFLLLGSTFFLVPCYNLEVPFYWSAQITGSVIASFILRQLLHPITDLGTTTPSGTPWQALVMEIIVTFCMMFVTLAVATDTKAVGELAGLAVGSSVCITSILAGPVSGGSMNPARTLGPALASKRYNSLWVYFLGPALGTLSGGSAYTFIRLNDAKPQDGSQRSSSLKSRRLQRQGSSSLYEEVDLENV